MPLNVQSGDSVSILCKVTGDQPRNLYWQTENNQSLSNTVRAQWDTLTFNYITPADEGKYICTAEYDHGRVSKVAQVIVGRKYEE